MVASLSRVGPYSVLRPLGAGGMAETFIAERRGPGTFVQRVCLKRIRTDMADDPELVRQFMSEAAIAVRLRHAAIASVLDFGEDRGVFYMAIELIDGTDLREVIHAAPSGLPTSLVLYIAVELTTALATAHDAGVVHRDVSPSNVLVSRAGEVKLADFGIARADTAPSHTRTGIVRGKVPYMAPEYARTGRFDARADLFSLGVLLYECAYGERPFDGATDLETLERATRGERTPLTARPEPLPDGFETILDHLLDADPDRRFATAGAALEALLSLPNDARARRELGARVSALKPQALESHDASFADTALAAPVRSDQATRTLASEPLVVPQRKLGPLLALGAAALALISAVGLWLRAPGATAEPVQAALPATAAPKTEAPPPSPAPAPATLAAATPDPVLRPVQPAPAAPPHQDEQEQPKLGWLEVNVMPFGAFYVNDVLYPQGHGAVRVPAGTHTVRAQQGGPPRRVQVRAGKRTSITLE